MRNSKMTMLGLFLLVVAAGCNEGEAGGEGIVEFTPTNCGVLNFRCSFLDPIAAGAAIDVEIDTPAPGETADDLELVSSNPAVFDVVPVPPVAGERRWEIQAFGEGTADLLAVDLDGFVIDFLPVDVVELDALNLDEALGNADGFFSDPDFHEVWEVPANRGVVFFTTPTAGGFFLMGRLNLDVLENELEPHLDTGADPIGGYFPFRAPAGDYIVSLASDNGTVVDVLFQVD